MGQKVNPNSIRLLINDRWKSLWFSSANYTENLISDLEIRRMLEKKLRDASLSQIQINRDANKISIDIHSSRPGVIIGRGGQGTEELKRMIAKKIKGNGRIQINIIEVKKPDADANIIGLSVASQMERRIPFRRAIKQAIEKAKNSGVKGIKIVVSGRLNGAEIARSEKASYGTVPLSTFKSDIDYTSVTALTTYGIVGIKVWIYKGEKGVMDIPSKSSNFSKK